MRFKVDKASSDTFARTTGCPHGNDGNRPGGTIEELYSEALLAFEFDPKDSTINLESLEHLNRFASMVGGSLIIYTSPIRPTVFSITIYDDYVE